MVIEECMDFSQPLAIEEGPHLPQGGILTWVDVKNKILPAIFPSYKAAQKAIFRTEHYRLAFDEFDHPCREFCTILPVKEIDA